MSEIPDEDQLLNTCKKERKHNLRTRSWLSYQISKSP